MERLLGGRVVRVWPLKQATEYAGREGCAIISISGDGDPRADLKRGWGDVLRLEFIDDSPRGIFNLAIALDKSSKLTDDKVEELEGFMRHCATQSQMELALKFALYHKENRNDDLHIHCGAGISRSLAMGICIADYFRWPIWAKAFEGEPPPDRMGNPHVRKLMQRAIREREERRQGSQRIVT